jgi:N6-adenosine-specific RNA methylase IME4
VSTDWPFGDLRPLGYGAILADPPWHYEMYSEKGWAKAPMGKYNTMPDEELKALPVGHLAGRDCMLVMWAVWPRIEFALEVMKCWGFTYVTGGAWVKRTTSGKIRWGTGYTLRSGCEPFLIGRLGGTQKQPRNILNVLEGVAREHSRKPLEMRALVERMTPNAFRCELFAREAWPGNSVWGNESEKFNGDSPDDSPLRADDRHHDDADPQLSEEASRGTLL